MECPAPHASISRRHAGRQRTDFIEWMVFGKVCHRRGKKTSDPDVCGVDSLGARIVVRSPSRLDRAEAVADGVREGNEGRPEGRPSTVEFLEVLGRVLEDVAVRLLDGGAAIQGIQEM
jgi:hypothetical protein